MMNVNRCYAGERDPSRSGRRKIERSESREITYNFTPRKRDSARIAPRREKPNLEGATMGRVR